jgi:hypothetical protein
LNSGYGQGSAFWYWDEVGSPNGSTCGKCNGHSFELAPFAPLGTNRKFAMVQCSGCGAPIGVLDSATGAQIDGLKSQIAAIDAGLNRIAKALQLIGPTD